MSLGNRWHPMFEFVTREVWGAGGDGDGTVIFRDTNVGEVSKEFEEWMLTHPKLSRWPYKRHDIETDLVLFTDGSNENIIFASQSREEQVKTVWNQEVWLEVF